MLREHKSSKRASLAGGAKLSGGSAKVSYLNFGLSFRHNFNSSFFKPIRWMFSVTTDKFKATQVNRILKFDQNIVSRLRHKSPIKSFTTVSSTQAVLFVVFNLGFKGRWRVPVRGEKADFAKLFVF